MSSRCHGPCRLLGTVALICAIALVAAQCRRSENEAIFDTVDGQRFTWRERLLIQSTLDATVVEVKKLLPRLPPRVRLRVQAGKRIIPETGESASVSPPDVVYWTVDTSRPEGVTAIVRRQLRGTLFHEFHHLVRAASLGSGRSLLDDVVTEGLATVFERDFARVAVPWGDYPNDVETWAAEVLTLGENGSRDQWMIRHPDGRRWIGYKVGTYWVDRATRASGRSAADMVSLTTNEILGLAASPEGSGRVGAEAVSP
jgi:uncharacterized protein YjaZ